MKYEETSFTVSDLVAAWEDKSLALNPEYQRGSAWSLQQQQGLIDSVFRSYPIPALFLHRIVSSGGLAGTTSTRFEIVDGQQRIRALADYLGAKFALLDTTDKKLRLPTSMRSRPAPWARLTFVDLPADLRSFLERTGVRVYLIEGESDDDEIRDLFIRLQSGTALGRQQIRDAWPGRVGPFVTALAGKMDRRPSCRLFRIVDQRGHRSEDDGDRDEYVSDRQTCAQLLKMFLVREENPWVFPSVTAGELDALYHEKTDFDERGDLAGRFKDVLGAAEKVLTEALILRKGDGVNKKKFKKLEVFAIVALLHDLIRNPVFKFTTAGLNNLAKQIIQARRDGEPAGRVTSGSGISEYYEWWRKSVVAALPGVEIDPVRVFPGEVKQRVFADACGKCAICLEEVEDGDAEYDHFPIPHRNGGRTVFENCRLVHKQCHPRGRPQAEEQ